MSVVVSTSSGVKYFHVSDLNKPARHLAGCAFNSLACSSDDGGLFGLAEGGLKQLGDDGIMDHRKAYGPGETAAVTALAARQKGNEILFAQGSKIFSYDIRTKRVTGSSLEGHKPSAQITKLAINIADSNIASLTSTSILVHSLTPPHTRISIKAPSDSPFTSLAFSRYKKTTLMTGHANGIVSVWDISKPNAPLRQKEVVRGEVIDISYSPYNKRLCAIAGRQGDAALVDLEEGDKPFHKTIQSTTRLTCIAFLPGGSLVVAGTLDGQLRLYNLRSLKEPPTEIRVSDDGGSVLAVMVNNKVETTATESGSKESTPKGIAPKPTPLAEHPTNLPILSDTHAGVRRSMSSTATEDKVSRRSSVAPVKESQKPISASLRASISPPRIPVRVSASRKSVASTATPSSPHLPSVTSSPLVRTKPVSRLTGDSTNSTAASRQVRPTGGSAARSVSNESQKEGRNKLRRSTSTVTPTSSPPRSASPTVKGTRLQPPKESTSSALVPSPLKRNSTGPAAMLLNQALNPQGSDLLRAAFTSAMSDWRAESSRATRNLHMEVIRSARLQQNEFRRMMEEYMDEVRRLREENELLRNENERLRRGY